MSNNVTSIIDFPININVISNPPPNIIINKAGVQGSPGTNGIGSGSFVNVSGFITTGQSSGLFYSNFNLNQYSNSGDVSGISGYLQSQINSVNNITGNFSTNNNLYLTGSNLYNSIIGISGLLYNTGNILNNKITSLSGYTNNALALITGIVYVTGDQTINGSKTFISPITVGQIYNGLGTEVNLNFTYLSNFAGLSLDWSAKTLVDNSSNASLDWDNRGLSGSWFQNNNPILDSSFPRVTGISIANSNIHLTGYVTFSAGDNDTQLGQSLNGIVILVPGVQQSGIVLHNQINSLSGLLTMTGTILNVSGVNATSFTLGNRSFYIYKNSSSGIWTLPSISQSTGRTYFIKNQGNTLTLTGQSSDLFFSNQLVTNYLINSGQAYIVANDGNYWSVM